MFSKLLHCIKSAVFGEEHEATSAAMNSLATTLHAQGKLREAQALYDQSLSIRSKLLGDDHPDTLATKENMSKMIALKDVVQVDEILETTAKLKDWIRQQKADPEKRAARRREAAVEAHHKVHARYGKWKAQLENRTELSRLLHQEGTAQFFFLALHSFSSSSRKTAQLQEHDWHLENPKLATTHQRI